MGTFCFNFVLNPSLMLATAVLTVHLFIPDIIAGIWIINVLSQFFFSLFLAHASMIFCLILEKEYKHTQGHNLRRLTLIIFMINKWVTCTLVWCSQNLIYLGGILTLSTLKTKPNFLFTVNLSDMNLTLFPSTSSDSEQIPRLN